MTYSKTDSENFADKIRVCAGNLRASPRGRIAVPAFHNSRQFLSASCELTLQGTFITFYCVALRSKLSKLSINNGQSLYHTFNFRSCCLYLQALLLVGLRSGDGVTKLGD